MISNFHKITSSYFIQNPEFSSRLHSLRLALRAVRVHQRARQVARQCVSTRSLSRQLERLVAAFALRLHDSSSSSSTKQSTAGSYGSDTAAWSSVRRAHVHIRLNRTPKAATQSEKISLTCRFATTRASSSAWTRSPLISASTSLAIIGMRRRRRSRHRLGASIRWQWWRASSRVAPAIVGGHNQWYSRLEVENAIDSRELPSWRAAEDEEQRRAQQRRRPRAATTTTTRR